MNEQDFIKAAREHYIRETESVSKLWQHIQDNTIPDDEELAYYWDLDSSANHGFDVVLWINSECLDIDSHDILLSTGGPATGIVLIQDHPYFWYQDWWKEKYTEPLWGGARDFYNYIFETMKELA